MNQEPSFESYLTGRASEIDVPGAGPSAVVERARGRRRRRRAGAGAVLGVAVLLGGAVVGQGLRPDDDAQEITSYGAVVGSPVLDWTMADVGNGLGWARDIVRSESGTVYGLSTSAGPGGSPEAYRPVVYGSSDGSEWTPAAMPDDVRVNGLAASGDTIYAVGTGGAGGVVRVASSDDPASGWTVTDLPLDLDAESVGLPGRLYIAETDVATAGGTTVVAATVMLKVDTEALVAGEENPSEWYPERDGMVRWVCDVEGGGDPALSTSMPGRDLTDEEQAELDAYQENLESGALDAEAAALDAAGSWPDEDSCGESARQVKSWAELGIDPAVGDLVAGEVRLFSGGGVDAAEGSGDTEEIPSFGYVTTIAGSHGTQVLAGDDGFWVVNPALPIEASSGVAMEATEARWSPDGIDWSSAPIEIDGMGWASGEFDGAQQVLTADWSSGSVVLHRLGAGTTSSLDLSEVVGLSDDRYFSAAEIGPLGVVIVTGDSTGQKQVLHSADGTSYGRTEIPTAPGGKKLSVNGVTMSADAVKVRLNIYPTDDVTGGPPEGQRLFVGTPR